MFSTLGQWHIFGCACLKRKWWVCPKNHQKKGCLTFFLIILFLHQENDFFFFEIPFGGKVLGVCPADAILIIQPWGRTWECHQLSIKVDFSLFAVMSSLFLCLLLKREVKCSLKYFPNGIDKLILDVCWVNNSLCEWTPCWEWRKKLQWKRAEKRLAK